MKSVYLAGCFLLLSLYAESQVWLPLGKGVRPYTHFGDAAVYALAVDSIHNLLYAGGDFYYAGDTISRELAVWNGEKWLTTEHNSLKYFNEPMRALLARHDTIFYATGGYVSTFKNDTIITAIVFPKIGGVINCMIFYRDTLYAGGNFGLLKYNGKEWKTVGAQIDAGIPPRVDALYIPGSTHHGWTFQNRR